MAPALAHHLVVHGGDAVQNALDVDVDAAAPGIHCLGVVPVEGKRHDAGVVDHDVDGAESVHCGGGKPLHVGKAGDVRGLGGRLVTGITNRGHRFLEALIIDVGTDNFGAQRSALLADQAAKAAACASDDDHSAIDGLIQFTSPRVGLLKTRCLACGTGGPAVGQYSPDITAT